MKEKLKGEIWNAEEEEKEEDAFFILLVAWKVGSFVSEWEHVNLGRRYANNAAAAAAETDGRTESCARLIAAA